jgi:hypothetical protein
MVRLSLLILTGSPAKWEINWPEHVNGMLVSLVKDWKCQFLANIPLPSPTMRLTTDNIFDSFVIYKHAVANHLEQSARFGRVDLANLKIACIYNQRRNQGNGIAILTWEDKGGETKSTPHVLKVDIVKKFASTPPPERLATLLAKFGTRS